MSAALGVVLVTFGAIAVASTTVWLGLRTYRAPRLAWVLACGLLGGSAVFGVVVVVSALRHFGGRVTIIGGRTGGYACAQWWAQLDSFNGVTNDHVTTSPDCRRAAVDAVGSALVQSALFAAAAAVLVGGFLALRMRSSHPV